MHVPVKQRIVRGTFERMVFGIILLAKMVGVAKTKEIVHRILAENPNPIRTGKELMILVQEIGRER